MVLWFLGAKVSEKSKSSFGYLGRFSFEFGIGSCATAVVVEKTSGPINIASGIMKLTRRQRGPVLDTSAASRWTT